MAATYSSYCLGFMASLKFLGIENMTSRFWPMSIMANGWVGQDTTWCGGRPRPRRHDVCLFLL